MMKPFLPMRFAFGRVPFADVCKQKFFAARSSFSPPRFITPPREIPDAEAILEDGGDTWNWRVRSCPICGCHHLHGAGFKAADPRVSLGHRSAQCIGAAGGVVYRLVDSQPALTQRLYDNASRS